MIIGTNNTRVFIDEFPLPTGYDIPTNTELQPVYNRAERRKKMSTKSKYTKKKKWRKR